ncbi:MAG: hypothetical protein AVDCRST_MAG74-779, partial [uncultured Pyrinomonadaceae bacterium]
CACRVCLTAVHSSITNCKVRVMTVRFAPASKRSLKRASATASPASMCCSGVKAGRIVISERGAFIANAAHLSGRRLVFATSPTAAEQSGRSSSRASAV